MTRKPDTCTIVEAICGLRDAANAHVNALDPSDVRTEYRLGMDLRSTTNELNRLTSLLETNLGRGFHRITIDCIRSIAANHADLCIIRSELERVSGRTSQTNEPQATLDEAQIALDGAIAEYRRVATFNPRYMIAEVRDDIDESSE